jgi:hypothetical protein
MEGEAWACGGCFHPEEEPAPQPPPGQPPEVLSMVTAHRMALAVSVDGSVLWDQVQYAGSPEEFAWVLPVKPGARLEVASDAWFEALDAATATRMLAPTILCSGSGSGSGSGSSGRWDDDGSYGRRMHCQMSPGSPGHSPVGLPASGLSGCTTMAEGEGSARVTPPGGEGGRDGGGSFVAPPDAQAPEADPVSVVHQGSAGPYETVTIHSDVPGAAMQWLLDHGFAVDADMAIVLQDYEAEGYDFIALRLLPDAGVQQMTPVRVHLPGAVTMLPLRMVAAGMGAYVDLTLFVIGEGRWQIVDDDRFVNVRIDEDIVWDFADQRSSFSEARASALEAYGGRAWLTSYAQPRALLAPLVNPVTQTTISYDTELASTPTIADAYVSQGLANGETDVDCVGQFAALSALGDKVVAPCEGEGCPEPGDGVDARLFECGALMDLRAAFTGMHPRDVWLTRLEAFLPKRALAFDLTLTAAAQEPVANWRQADTYVNPPCVVVTAMAHPRAARPAAIPAMALLVLAAAGLAATRRLRPRGCR